MLCLMLNMFMFMLNSSIDETLTICDLSDLTCKSYLYSMFISK